MRERELRRLCIITKLSGASASDPSRVWGLGFLLNERDDAASEREMMHFDGGRPRKFERSSWLRGSSRGRGSSRAREVVKVNLMPPTRGLVLIGLLNSIKITTGF